jgi:molybdate transport system ATP-binding protein
MTLEASVETALGALSLSAQLRVDDGEVVVLLGPNGAGKTTLLRALAGLVPLSAGRVAIDGDILDDPERGRRVPPHQRPIGFVFQDYLLFPNLSAVDNVAFGLRARGMDRRTARREAHAWLERLSIGDHARAKPRALSGGQAQRVALARALAIRPRLLLLDEPLAALDAGARGEIRRELKRQLDSFSGARLVVTHDPLEALALADRLVVLENGRITQTARPDELTARPRTSYVANLVGVNLLAGRARGHSITLGTGAELVVAEEAAGDVLAAVHPRAVALHRRRPEGSPRNVWRGTIADLDSEGERVRVRVDGDIPIVAEVTPAALSELRLSDAGPVWVSVKASEISVYPA